MNQSPYSIAVQITSRSVQHKENPEVVLPSAQRTEISRQFEQHFTIHWLPPNVRKRQSRMLSVDSTVYIFIQGLLVGSLLKPFFESMVKEAGKDFWTALKQFAARVWKAQADRSYKFRSTTYFIFQLEEDFLAIPVVFIGGSEKLTLEQCEQHLSNNLEDISASWPAILADIEKFRLGKTSTTHIHLITRDEAKRWMIHPMESSDFFK